MPPCHTAGQVFALGAEAISRDANCLFRFTQCWHGYLWSFDLSTRHHDHRLYRSIFHIHTPHSFNISSLFVIRSRLRCCTFSEH